MSAYNCINEKKKIVITKLMPFYCFDVLKVFQKIVKQSLNWPAERSAHSSTIITTVSSNEHLTSHLVVLGGLRDGLQPTKDCWIMKLSNLEWYQVSIYLHHMKYFYNVKH